MTIEWTDSPNAHDYVFVHTHGAWWRWLPFQPFMTDGQIACDTWKTILCCINKWFAKSVCHNDKQTMNDKDSGLMVLTILLLHEMRQCERNSLPIVATWLILTDRGHAHELHYTHILLLGLIPVLSCNIDGQWNLWICVCIDCICNRTIMDKLDYDCIQQCNCWQAFKTISCLWSWILIFVWEERCLAFPNLFCWWPMWCLTLRNSDIQWHCSDRNMQGPCT